MYNRPLSQGYIKLARQNNNEPLQAWMYESMIAVIIDGFCHPYIVMMTIYSRKIESSLGASSYHVKTEYDQADAMATGAMVCYFP